MKAHLKTAALELKKDRYVDENTGEVIEVNEVIKHSYVAGKEEFFLAYSYLLDMLKSCKDLKVKVYAYLLQNYKTGVKLQIGNPIKKDIAEKFDCSVSSVSNVLTVLKEEKLLFSPSRGVYMLNPRFAFKGTSGERRKQLKVILELGCKDC